MTRATKKKTAGRASAKKTSAVRRRQRAAISLHAASPARQAKLFRALRRVMKEHGVVNEIAALHLAPAAESAPQECPPGQVSRIVCFRRDDGTVVCESRCQPI